MRKINKVSVVIRAKNEEKNIDQCLKKVFEQKIDIPFEVILVYDSRSRDRTLEIAKKFPCKILQTKDYLKKFSYGAALNLGTKYSQGEIVVFLSADATPKDRFWLTNLIKPFLKNENLTGVYGRQIPKKDCFPWEKKDIESNYPLDHLKQKKETLKFSNANSAILKNIWQKINFDENLPIAEDIKWLKEVKKLGYSIKYQPMACVFHSHNHTLLNTIKIGLKRGKAHHLIGILKPSFTNAFALFIYLFLLFPRLFKQWLKKILRDDQYYRQNNIKLKWRLISPFYRFSFILGYYLGPLIYRNK